MYESENDRDAGNRISKEETCKMVNITQYDAVGDGKTNCSPALEKALENETELYFPGGCK